MNDILLDKIQELKKAIDGSLEAKELKNLDNELTNNEEVMKLAYLKDMAVIEYEDCLKHFKEGSKEVVIAQKKLHEAKLALDNHELVQRYNKQFKIVKQMYEKINLEIFSKFN